MIIMKLKKLDNPLNENSHNFIGFNKPHLNFEIK